MDSLTKLLISIVCKMLYLLVFSHILLGCYGHVDVQLNIADNGSHVSCENHDQVNLMIGDEIRLLTNIPKSTQSVDYMWCNVNINVEVVNGCLKNETECVSVALKPFTKDQQGTWTCEYYFNTTQSLQPLAKHMGPDFTYAKCILNFVAVDELWFTGLRVDRRIKGDSEKTGGFRFVYTYEIGEFLNISCQSQPESQITKWYFKNEYNQNKTNLMGKRFERKAADCSLKDATLTCHAKNIMEPKKMSRIQLILKCRKPGYVDVQLNIAYNESHVSCENHDQVNLMIGDEIRLLTNIPKSTQSVNYMWCNVNINVEVVNGCLKNETECVSVALKPFTKDQQGTWTCEYYFNTTQSLQPLKKHMGPDFTYAKCILNFVAVVDPTQQTLASTPRTTASTAVATKALVSGAELLEFKMEGIHLKATEGSNETYYVYNFSEPEDINMKCVVNTNRYTVTVWDVHGEKGKWEWKPVGTKTLNASVSYRFRLEKYDKTVICNATENEGTPMYKRTHSIQAHFIYKPIIPDAVAATQKRQSFWKRYWPIIVITSVTLLFIIVLVGIVKFWINRSKVQPPDDYVNLTSDRVATHTAQTTPNKTVPKMQPNYCNPKDLERRRNDIEPNYSDVKQYQGIGEGLYAELNRPEDTYAEPYTDKTELYAQPIPKAERRKREDPNYGNVFGQEYVNSNK